MKRYIKLSYNISVDTPLYPETPPIVIEKVKEISKGDLSNTFLISFLNHAGTHIDAPRHFWDSGRPISEYSIEELIFDRPLLLDCPKGLEEAIVIDDLANLADSSEYDLLLIKTGFSRYRTTQSSVLNSETLYHYCYRNPYLSPDAAVWIKNNFSNIRAIGIDCISVASHSHREQGRESHKILLKEDGFKTAPVLIIEDMDLSGNLSGLKQVMVFPLRIEGVDSAPCTVIGIMNYKSFEELPCWNSARELCKMVFELINNSKIKDDYSLRDQMLRSSGSIMDNIAEGFDDVSSYEFVRFLGYSQRSCSELQSQLYRALDCSYINNDQFAEIYNLVSECRKQLKGFRRYLRDYKSKNEKINKFLNS